MVKFALGFLDVTEDRTELYIQCCFCQDCLQQEQAPEMYIGKEIRKKLGLRLTKKKNSLDLKHDLRWV